jgi:hypothetical protein
MYAVAPVTPLNALLAMVGLLAKKYTLFRALAFSNALASMDVTPAGMVMAVRAVALRNALPPMDVSWLPAPNVTVTRLLVPQNA